MKKLFIYYSYTGNGDVVAEHLAARGFDVLPVKRKRKLPGSFFFSILTGGFLAGIKHKDKLLPYDADFDAYDEIVIGSPVWNGRISSPVNTLLADKALKGKTLSFLLYAGSGAAPKAEKRLRKEFPAARRIVLKDPKKYPEELAKTDVL